MEVRITERLNVKNVPCIITLVVEGNGSAVHIVSNKLLDTIDEIRRAENQVLINACRKATQ